MIAARTPLPELDGLRARGVTGPVSDPAAHRDLLREESTRQPARSVAEACERIAERPNRQWISRMTDINFPFRAASAMRDGEDTRMECLFEGAYRVACREIGHPAGDGAEGDEAVAAFRDWSKALARDARMMAPIFHDVVRGRTKVWAFLGWDRTLPHVRYEARPAVVSCERDLRPRRPADEAMTAAAYRLGRAGRPCSPGTTRP